MNKVLVALVAGSLPVLGAGAVGAQQQLPFSDGKWELPSAGVALAREGEREVLEIENGIVYRRDVRLQDGTIEFDVQVTRRRSFVYLAFRMVDDREYEEFYLRPHKSGLPDALQYAPVYQGHSAWQLYHDAGSTAALEFEPGVWTHVKLVLRERQAALFIGSGERPALVSALAREPVPGYLMLRGFLPPGVPGAGPIARFAGVTVRPDFAPFDFSQPGEPPASTSEGVVRAWAVSRAFPGEETPRPTLPEAGTLGEFRRLEALPGGLLELHRWVPLPPAAGASTAGRRPLAAAVARLRLRVAKATVQPFDLGFSDLATVFLNGRPLFWGDARYSFDRPRREGLIGFDQARLWLPLAAGDNELAVLVGDSFGGWGLMGRFPDAQGLEIDAR